MKKTLASTAVIGALGVAVAAAPSANAAGTGKITSVTRSGCVLTITTTVSAPGSYEVAVWDDRIETGDYAIKAAKAGTYTVTHTFKKNVGTKATGIDIMLNDTAAKSTLDHKRNWDFPGSSHVLDSCKKSDGKDSGETTTPTKPTKPTKPAGPKVDTDYVAPASHGDDTAALAFGGLAVAGAAGYFARRKFSAN